MWFQLFVLAQLQDEIDFLEDFNRPYGMELLLAIIQSDGEVEEEETAYIMQQLLSLQNVIAQLNGEEVINSDDNSLNSSSTQAMPLNVTKVGGTTGPKDRDGDFNILLGVDIENPNSDKIATGVTVEITLKSSTGSITEVITDTLYCIDAGATFHYGYEKRWISGDVSNISANAYAREFIDVGGNTFMDGAIFSNFSIYHDDGECDITGEIRSTYNKTIDGCYLYYQLKKDGEIVGGNSTYIDVLPAGATRSLKINNSVDVQAAQLEYSVDFDLDSLLN